MVQRPPGAGPTAGASPTVSTSTASPTRVPPFHALVSPQRRHPRSSSLCSPKNRSRAPLVAAHEASSPLRTAPRTSLCLGKSHENTSSRRSRRVQHRDLASPSLGPARPTAPSPRPLSPMVLDSDPEGSEDGDYDVGHQLVPGRRPSRQLDQARRPSLSSTPEHDPQPFSPFPCDYDLNDPDGLHTLSPPTSMVDEPSPVREVKKPRLSSHVESPVQPTLPAPHHDTSSHECEVPAESLPPPSWRGLHTTTYPNGSNFMQSSGADIFYKLRANALRSTRFLPPSLGLSTYPSFFSPFNLVRYTC